MLDKNIAASSVDLCLMNEGFLGPHVNKLQVFKQTGRRSKADGWIDQYKKIYRDCSSQVSIFELLGATLVHSIQYYSHMPHSICSI